MRQETTRHRQGVLIMLAAMLVISPDTMIISLVEADRPTLLFWRGLLVGVTLHAATLLLYRGRAHARIRELGSKGLLSALLFAGSTLLFVTSVTLTTAANTLVIIAATPLLAALASRLFLGEAVPLRTWVAVGGCFAGIALLFSGSLGGGALVGDLCALAATACIAANLTLVRHMRSLNMVPAVAGSGYLVALAMLPLASPLSPGGLDLLLLPLLGFFILPLSFGLLILAPRYLPAPEVSLMMLLETVLGPLWVWLALGEVPASTTFAGGGMVLATLLLHSLAGLRAGDSTPPPPPVL